MTARTSVRVRWSRRRGRLARQVGNSMAKEALSHAVERIMVKRDRVVGCTATFLLLRYLSLGPACACSSYCVVAHLLVKVRGVQPKRWKCAYASLARSPCDCWARHDLHLRVTVILLRLQRWGHNIACAFLTCMLSL